MSDVWRGGNSLGIGIVRVSSRRQDGNTSHDVQEGEIRTYCARNRIRVVEVFRIVESAKDSDDRKQYAQAISSALARQVRHVLFYMNDREARNLTDNERNEKLVRAGVICIHYVHENKVLHADSSESDFFIRDVYAVTNKQYSRQIATKVKDALQEKAESGWWPGSKPPLGYAHQAIDDGTGRARKAGKILVPDPDERKVAWVRREFELRAQGFSYHAIVQTCIEEGLVPAERIRKYGHGVVEHRLVHALYRGLVPWEGRIYPGKHERIIPQEHLDAIERIGRGKSKTTRMIGEYGGFGNGRIRCAECGCQILYDPKTRHYRNGTTQTFHYYRCSNGRRAHPNLKGLAVTEDAIWSQLDRVVDEITIAPGIAAEIAKALNETERATRSRLLEQLHVLRAELVSLEKREDETYRDLKSGLLTQESYLRQVDSTRAQRRKVAREIAQLERARDGQHLETVESTLELARSAKSLYLSRTKAERRELLEMLLSNLSLRGRTIEYSLKKPFRLLIEMTSEGEWLAKLADLRTYFVRQSQEEAHEIAEDF